MYSTALNRIDGAHVSRVCRASPKAQCHGSPGARPTFPSPQLPPPPPTPSEALAPRARLVRVEAHEDGLAAARRGSRRPSPPLLQHRLTPLRLKPVSHRLRPRLLGLAAPHRPPPAVPRPGPGAGPTGVRHLGRPTFVWDRSQPRANPPVAFVTSRAPAGCIRSRARIYPPVATQPLHGARRPKFIRGRRRMGRRRPARAARAGPRIARGRCPRRRVGGPAGAGLRVGVKGAGRVSGGRVAGLVSDGPEAVAGPGVGGVRGGVGWGRGGGLSWPRAGCRAPVRVRKAGRRRAPGTVLQPRRLSGCGPGPAAPPNPEWRGGKYHAIGAVPARAQHRPGPSARVHPGHRPGISPGLVGPGRRPHIGPASARARTAARCRRRRGPSTRRAGCL